MKSTVINSSKEMSAYSDFPPPAHFANFMHNRQMLHYLRMFLGFLYSEANSQSKAVYCIFGLNTYSTRFGLKQGPKKRRGKGLPYLGPICPGSKCPDGPTQSTIMILIYLKLKTTFSCFFQRICCHFKIRSDMYAERFDLVRHINFRTTVLEVKRSANFDKDGCWTVTFKKE